MLFQNSVAALLCSALIQGSSLNQRFQVKVDGFQFQALAAPNVIGKQRKSNWCWAAAIQMVLNYHGIFATQEHMVQQKFRALVDQPANGVEIMNALNGFYWSIFASKVRVSSWVIDMTTDTKFLELLADKKPIIAGLYGSNTEAAGHAYVVTGAEYSLHPSGLGVIVHAVTVRDPWPVNASEQSIPFEQFRRRFVFAVGISVTPMH